MQKQAEKNAKKASTARVDMHAEGERDLHLQGEGSIRVRVMGRDSAEGEQELYMGGWAHSMRLAARIRGHRGLVGPSCSTD